MKRLFLVLLSLFVISGNAGAASVTLAWDSASAEDTGYNIYYKTSPFDPYINKISLGMVNIYTIKTLNPGVKYYFVITALWGTAESGYSNEVIYQALPPCIPSELKETVTGIVDKALVDQWMFWPSWRKTVEAEINKNLPWCEQ